MLTGDETRAALIAQLSLDERQHAILYQASPHIPPGPLEIGRQNIVAPWPACLAFVDREPTANWGHSCRYVLLNTDTSEILSFEVRFPPFQGNDRLTWRTIYQSPTAPAWAVKVPHQE
jgi:hypothetical protein